MQTLSLCMIVKDEERTLPGCLDSVAGLQPEIIIVDTGSTDATREIALSRGAKVSEFDFSFVDFAAARNRGLALATGRWILVLDSDETLLAESVPLVEQMVSRDENAGYYFERVNERADAQAPSTDFAVRLFPNRPGYRYRGRVHETIDASILAGGGRLVRSGIRIRHDFSGDAESRRERNLRYIGILNEEIAADPGDHTRLIFLAAEYHQLGMLDEATRISERIVAMRPLDPAAHLQAAAYHLLYQGDYRRARADCEEALRLRPGDTEARSMLDLIDEQEHATSAS